jgi:WD40 repeat protein
VGGELLSLQSDARVDSLAFSPDAKLLAAGGHNGKVKVWELETGKALHSLGAEEDGVPAVAFSPDGRTLAAAPGLVAKQIRLWEMPSGTARKPIDQDGWGLRGLFFSPDGRSLIVAHGDLEPGKSERRTSLRRWDLGTGTEQNSLKGLLAKDPISMALSPDDATAAIAIGEGPIWVGDVRTGRQKWVGSIGPKGRLELAMAFSPDGKTLAVAGGDAVVARDQQAGFLKLLDAENGQERLSLTGHEGRVYAIAFTPDGKTLISGGDDKTVRFWDVETGKERRKVQQSDPVPLVKLSPGGAILALYADSFGQNLKVTLWGVAELLDDSREKQLAELKKVAVVEKLDDGYYVSVTEKATDDPHSAN